MRSTRNTKPSTQRKNLSDVHSSTIRNCNAVIRIMSKAIKGKISDEEARSEINLQIETMKKEVAQHDR